MTHMLKRNRGGNSNDSSVEEYKEAGKNAKKAISMIMDGLEDEDMNMVMEGAKSAWKSVKKMCEISDEMEQQFGERSGEGYGERGYQRFANRDDWNERDDQWMERRMRDSMGRFK